MKSVIATIARANNDHPWPLAMLRALQPKLADALTHWSAGGFEDIRIAQESDTVALDSHAGYLERYFSLLPKWHKNVQHVSKDPEWLSRVAGGTLVLKSFMSCSASGYNIASISPPCTILKFTNLTSARLVGALSTEILEGEVLLPREAVFSVVSKNYSSKIIVLAEVSS